MLYLCFIRVCWLEWVAMKYVVVFAMLFIWLRSIHHTVSFTENRHSAAALIFQLYRWYDCIVRLYKRGATQGRKKKLNKKRKTNVMYMYSRKLYHFPVSIRNIFRYTFFNSYTFFGTKIIIIVKWINFIILSLCLNSNLWHFMSLSHRRLRRHACTHFNICISTKFPVPYITHNIPRDLKI